MAGGGHAGPQPGGHSPGQLQFNGGVVEDAAAGHQGVQPAGQPLGVQSRDVAQQVVGVGAEVTHDAGEPGNVRVGAPARLLVARAAPAARPPSRRRARRRRTSRAQLAVADHPGRVAHHRVRGVAVRDRQDSAVLGGEPTSSAAVSESRVSGFSHTTEMPASRKARAISKWLSLGVATTTTSTPSGRGGLRCCHFRVVPVGAVLRHAQLRGQGERTLPVAAEDARRAVRTGRPAASRSGGSCRCPPRLRLRPFLRPAGVYAVHS